MGERNGDQTTGVRGWIVGGLSPRRAKPDGRVHVMSVARHPGAQLQRAGTGARTERCLGIMVGADEITAGHPQTAAPQTQPCGVVHADGVVEQALRAVEVEPGTGDVGSVCQRLGGEHQITSGARVQRDFHRVRRGPCDQQVRCLAMHPCPPGRRRIRHQRVTDEVVAKDHPPVGLGEERKPHAFVEVGEHIQR